MDSRYSHLYKTSQYIAPSVIRSMEEATPARPSIFGDTISAYSGDNIESISGQTRMNNFINSRLKSKDVYKEMKNKTLYSLNSKITSHGILNSL